MTAYKFTSYMILVVFITIFNGHVTADIITAETVSWQVYVEDVPMCQALSFDSHGRLYVAHDGDRNNRIYKIEPDSPIAELFGPTVLDPDSVAVDPNDNVYIGTGSGKVYLANSEGIAALFADRLLANTCAMVVDHAGIIGTPGDLFVANARAQNDIVHIDCSGTSHEYVLNTDLYVPFALAFDDVGSLYVAEYSNNPGVYKIDILGEPELVKELNSPHSMIFDPVDRIFYVSSPDDMRIYSLSLDGRLAIFAEGIDARGLAFGPQGDLYVSDRTDGIDRILRFTGRGELRPGDFDLNGIVDMIDFAILSKAWQSEPDDNNWNPSCDLTLPRDYSVNIADFAVFVSSWLQDYSL